MSGKKFIDASKKFDRETMYTPADAVRLAKETATAKFDESVDVSFRLGIDPRKAEQMVRGTVALPQGTGKDVRVAVFASGEAANAAREAGADIVGADDLFEQIEGGMMDFDLVIATPDMMPLVGRLGRTLGPRGLMPNPKTGTVTPDVAKAVTEFKGGKVEYRTDRYGNVQLTVGKASFTPEALAENIFAVIEEVQRAKPASAKGRYIQKITVSSTMGPGVKVDILNECPHCGAGIRRFRLGTVRGRVLASGHCPPSTHKAGGVRISVAPSWQMLSYQMLGASPGWAAGSPTVAKWQS
jgi:large subunit ribosomal protein L1